MKNRRSALLLLTATLGLAGCEWFPWPPVPPDPGPGPGPGPTSRVTAIRFGEHYGFCAGYCQRDLSLGPTGRGTLVHAGRGRGTEAPPEIVRDVLLPTAERDRIWREAEATLTAGAWQPQYGCPDCADGGKLPLEIDEGGTTRVTVIDATQVPALFAPLVTSLRAVIARYPRAPKMTMCEPRTQSDPGVMVSDVSLKGDELAFKAGFGGGCAPHDFDLCWDGAWLESYPVQARLALRHTLGANDPCDAFITRELRFDLSPLKDAYRMSYPSPTGTGKISVGITGKNAGALYEF